jgi:hypothetical protein
MAQPSAMPQNAQEDEGLQAASEKSGRSGFVTGHDFSRAENVLKMVGL